MPELFYEVYFDPAELEVDSEGELVNENALYIAKLDAEGNVIRRVDWEGGNLEWDAYVNPENVQDLFHVGYCDDELVEAVRRFNNWLENHLEWRKSSSQTYLQPAEYMCIGIRMR